MTSEYSCDKFGTFNPDVCMECLIAVGCRSQTLRNTERAITRFLDSMKSQFIFVGRESNKGCLLLKFFRNKVSADVVIGNGHIEVRVCGIEKKLGVFEQDKIEFYSEQIMAWSDEQH